jgi:hypothetical protein
MRQFLLISIVLICFSTLNVNAQEKSKIDIGFESGIHLDIVELLRPSYTTNRPSVVPDEFELQKVLVGWNNRLRINYALSDK